MLKYFYLFFLPILLFAQPESEVIFYKNYMDIPVKIRIENSGIYGIKSFDIFKDTLKLFKSDVEETILYSEDNFVRVEKNREGSSGNSSLKKSVAFRDKNNVIVERNKLEISSSTGQKINLNFPGDLAYSEVIGLDKNNFMFVYTERYISEIPIKIKKEVYVLNSAGKIINTLKIPQIKYLSTNNDFTLDEDGNLYHLISDIDHLEIIKWVELTLTSDEIIKYPKEYNKQIDFNNYTTSKEIVTEKKNESLSKVLTVNRMDAVNIGEKYVYHQFYLDESNLAPNPVTASDGDEVETPSRFKTGINARVGYKWGGFNTIEQYDKGLNDGKFAADIHTSGVSSYAVGVDCSGFVSRCWQLTYHSATSMMPNITSEYSSWDDLKPGDAIHKFGHVRLFINRNPDGSFLVVEASARDWGVSYWSYKPSDLTNYTPRRLKSMENIYSGARPKIISTISSDKGTIIKWDCDTTALDGFRIYRSFDEQNFELIATEDKLKGAFSFVDSANYQGSAFYKVSSVKLIGADKGESLYSSIYGVNKIIKSDSSPHNILIVDGFSRRTGSWRGEENNLISRYLKSSSNSMIDMVSNSELLSDSVNMMNYDIVYWAAGDESTINETFNSKEQSLVKEFLENGGRFLVSGSEIGWDLDKNGSVSDKEFFRNYLKAIFIEDDARSQVVKGVSGSPYSDYDCRFGLTYEEDYPDAIAAFNGSKAFSKYGNGKTAAVWFEGTFGKSEKEGSLIYFAFPLETIAGDGTASDGFLKV